MRKNSKTTALFNNPEFQNYLREKFYINNDGDLCGVRGKPLAGSDQGIGYRIVSTCFNGHCIPVLQHRLAMFLHLGRIPGEIDHLDGDRGNNNIHNLREITHSLNVARMPKRKGETSSKYKGVSKGIADKKWTAVCARQYIGMFSDEIEAALAYDKHAVAIWGRDAWLNFPEHRSH